ncbi:dienelactone hydrolase [Natronococcus sp. JC468]|uniref:acyl-CoA thioester hydrolase/BAAT C-terminal domain-containing protein n=1 Tax=Natronococcus sp. JC468 TaxID=1961921 RepID=UPI00143884C3|nr:acyl-CoA thioester hydrolase/BAAT C-terminal domain-containing protein [Natronococcus sp. JC468]NKE37327.1 dienelactone hydrolase [Natronococcus sp. JC468]
MSRRQLLASLSGTAGMMLPGCSLPAKEASASFTHPQTLRIDEPFDLTVDGVPSNTELEIVLEGALANGETLRAGVTVESETDSVALNDARIIDGDLPADLDVPTAVALIQFADISWEEYIGTGAVPSDTEWPPDHTLTYRIETEERTIGELRLSRWHPFTSVGEAGSEFVGHVFEPPSGQSGPGILVLHGAGGKPQWHVAAMLAQHGFTAFALQYVSGPGLPDSPVEVPLEYVTSAVDWLRDHERVTSERIGMWGIGRGGELGLLVGSRHDAVGPVVSINGSGLLWEGGVVRGPPSGTPAWGLADDARSSLSVAEAGQGTDRLERYTDAIAAAGALELETATIPVEEINGPVLLVTGDDDRVWPSARLHELARERLDARNHPSFEHVRYAAAGRHIPQPYLPVRRSAGSTSGGTLAGNAEAAHAHWPRVLGTFSELQ